MRGPCRHSIPPANTPTQGSGWERKRNRTALRRGQSFGDFERDAKSQRESFTLKPGTWVRLIWILDSRTAAAIRVMAERGGWLSRGVEISLSAWTASVAAAKSSPMSRSISSRASSSSDPAEKAQIGDDATHMLHRLPRPLNPPNGPGTSALAMWNLTVREVT